MSYQVLARKWRPKRFAELVGQEHVVRALSHALDSGRIHHAFLFTGTRGVGKTTIARIFAKSLNCERGTSAEPCGVCSICSDIDAGRFFDLLEIDAASNTGVDDVRDLIENAQYMPARGRYKVYLIDEVHMLSKPAFNALLKTLEEPPDHAKFLLATTDPQKLLVTVLSRCLQFNLKRLTIEQIVFQVDRILAAEQVEHDSESVLEIARGGNGSLRDALSLLDQAIAFGGGKLVAAEVRSMLGTIDRGAVIDFLDTILRDDAAALATLIQQAAEFQPDYATILDAFAEAMHAVQVEQLIPNAANDAAWPVADFAKRMAPETVQLFYQLAISGRRDLALAPSPRIGFEMTLMRMLAFQPAPAAGDAPARNAISQRAASVASASAATTAAVADRQPTMSAPIASAPAPEAATTPRAAMTRSAVATAAVPALAEVPMPRFDALRWLDFVDRSELRGPAREFASNLGFIADDGDSIRVSLPLSLDHLRNEFALRKLQDALLAAQGRTSRIVVELAAVTGDTAATRAARGQSERDTAAEAAIAADPFVSRAISEFGARILPDSTRPID
ncbi:MAG: DNA polymerase III subunit gamma/tau [Rhodanobacteraceae bacterium]|nr:DNA polymerase III subunit gamma/tau [Rhodanobacteraceae bacterium]MBP9153853.1 DNA polymerase III subunit gamma/tau [Xanthomonadales bacterium]HQW82653.1 DNA polymerase III subunit gamma/tau [Pseudomonadota bacterium]